MIFTSLLHEPRVPGKASAVFTAYTDFMRVCIIPQNPSPQPHSPISQKYFADRNLGERVFLLVLSFFVHTQMCATSSARGYLAAGGSLAIIKRGVAIILRGVWPWDSWEQGD